MYSSPDDGVADFDFDGVLFELKDGTGRPIDDYARVCSIQLHKWKSPCRRLNLGQCSFSFSFWCARAVLESTKAVAPVAVR